jgi:S1-C subfamily serine protease
MDRLGVRVCTVAALGCAAVATHGCGDAAKPAAPSPAQRLDLGVVGVSAQIGNHDVLGSGIVVDGDRGLVLTAAHGVWGARSLRLATALGVLHGRIVARAPCDDLALLEVHPRIPGLATLPTAPAGSGSGALLRSLGRRHDAPASPLASIPVRMTSARLPAAEIPLPSAGIPLDSPLVPEISGGPVVDEASRLVGMAESMGAPGAPAPAVNVPWTHIRARLDELRPGPRRIFVGWAQQYRCVGRQHAYARAMHPGYRASDARLYAPIAPTRLPGTEGMDG